MDLPGERADHSRVAGEPDLMNGVVVLRMRRASTAAGAAVMALGAIVLCGWLLGVDSLKSTSSNLVPMKANTAAGFMLLGAALLSAQDGVTERRRLAGRLLAGAAAAIGLLTLSQYVAGWDLGIDELLFAEPAAARAGIPGRMAPTTAACLLALGLGIAVADRGWRWLRPVLAAFVLSVAAIALLGYAYGVDSLYRVSATTAMAVHTAAGFVVAAAGVLMLRPGRASLVAGRSAGGVLLRRVVPLGSAAIAALGSASLVGHRQGFYDSAFAISLLVLSSVAVLVGLTWWVARSLHRVDAEREGAEDRLRTLNQTLEQRVDARTAELASSEERLRALTDTARDGIVSADASGRIVYANGAATTMFGRGDLVGEAIVALMPDRYRDAHTDGMARFLAGAQARVIGTVVEVDGLRSDGSEFPLELSLSSWHDAGAPMFTAIVRDITERRRSEESERRRAARDALVARVAHAVAAATDLEHALTSLVGALAADAVVERVALLRHLEGDDFQVAAVAGPGAWRLGTGQVLRLDEPRRRREYAEGRPVIVADTAGPTASTLDHRLAAGGVSSYASFPILAAGEVRAVVSFSSSQVDGVDPETAALFHAVVRETSGTFNTLMLLDREREASTRLRELDALKNEFVGTVAHDLRSPMAVISGFADLLRSEEGLTATERSDLLERIAVNTDRVSALVNDVLDVARIESGGVSVDVRPFDLAACTERTVAEVLAVEPDRVCTVAADPGMAMALGDEEKCWRVLTNLVSNALKFSPPDQPVDVTLSRQDAEIQVTVADRGPGIAPEHVDALFQKFSRLPGSSGEPRPEGTGLGLYISRRLIEAQGGRIWVESSPGQGSRFCFTIAAASRA